MVGCFYLKFWSTGPRWSEIADFEPIFARSASAVTPSVRSSMKTTCNRKSTTRFPITYASYVAPKPLPLNGGSKTRNNFSILSAQWMGDTCKSGELHCLLTGECSFAQWESGRADRIQSGFFQDP